jgi:formamidopyrimidine-DNA glycosylase
VPELPEVETLRRDLDAVAVGRTIEHATVSGGARTFRRYGDAAGFAQRVSGRRLAAAGRRGKYLLLRLHDGGVVVVHLGMSGQLLWLDAGAAVAGHTHLVLRFASASPEPGPELRFVDPRTFGEVFFAAGVDATGVPVELSHLGVDPLDPGFTVGSLAAILGSRRTRLKSLLLDQRAVAGIGNLYADEILWAARLAPERPAGGLRPAEVRRLHAGIQAVLADAVAHRGSSLADAQYRDLGGGLGGHGPHHQAYGREGRPCRRCGRPIRRVAAQGRSTFSCPTCQPPRGSAGRGVGGG